MLKGVLPGDMQGQENRIQSQCCCSVAKSCPTVCDPVDCSTPCLPVHHQLPQFTHTHVHWVDDAIQLSPPLLPPSPLALSLCSWVLTFLLFIEKTYHQLHLSRMVWNFQQVIYSSWFTWLLLYLLSCPILLTLLSSSPAFSPTPIYSTSQGSFL